MKKTKAGLPNNCATCGTPQVGEWNALNNEQGKAGQGFCDACIKPKTKKVLPKKATRKVKK